MAKKYEDGRQGAAEQKEERVALIVMGVLTLLIWLCFSVFNFDTHAFYKRASTFDNIGGSIVALGSWVYLWWIVKEGIDGKQIAKFVVLLAFGLAWSCGFNFDYFGL